MPSHPDSAVPYEAPTVPARHAAASLTSAVFIPALTVAAMLGLAALSALATFSGALLVVAWVGYRGLQRLRLINA